MKDPYLYDDSKVLRNLLNIDQHYLAEHASMVRNALVFCCLDNASEPEHFRLLLENAVLTNNHPIQNRMKSQPNEGYYKSVPHEYIETYDSTNYETRIKEALKNAKIYFHTMEEE